jgi:signal transduction histidine kinase
VIAAAHPLTGGGLRKPQPVETLFAVSKAVGSRMNITEVLRQTTRELVRALAADFGSVWRVDPHDRELRPVGSYGVSPKRQSAKATEGVPARLLPSAVPDVGEAVYSSDSAKDPRFNHPLLRLLPHRSVLIQPLRVGGAITGLFAFVWTRSRHRFNDVELRLVDAVTQQAAIAIENAELLAEVQELNEHLEGRVRDRTSQLERAYEELRASREELRALTTHIEGVREGERTRIAREIHDELGQALTGLKMDLARVSRGDGGIDAAALPAAIDEMIGAVRRISSELRPQILDDLGLVAALEWHAQEFESRTGIMCRIRRQGTARDADVDAERSTALFRIFQEILTNVARHAQATRVSVSLDIGTASVRMSIRDNGRGIRDASRASAPCLGILGMKERAAVFGGRVAITGHPRRGTIVRVRIPIPRREWKGQRP